MMVNSTDTTRPRSIKFLIPAAGVLVLVLLGFLAYAVWNTRSVVPVSSGPAPISQAVLEDQYGLQVKLVGVTAAGGMVDLRLKVLDAAKARLLLQGQANYPALFIEDRGVTLGTPEEIKAQELKLEDDGMIFILFPNSRNVVKPGSQVTITFGDVHLEPIVAQ